VSSNGKRTLSVVGVIVMAATLMLGTGLATRLLNVETRAEAATARDALKVELDGGTMALDVRLRKIEAEVMSTRTDVEWIKSALQDAGYRAPRAKP